MDLFSENQTQKITPLASRIRPEDFEDFVGQEHLVTKGKLLRAAIENDQLFSIILWGPPGSGKTTLARIVAKKTGAQFVQFSAVTSGVADVKKVVGEARVKVKLYNQRTILFVDEIHRFNKAQQDAFLPSVEDGTIILIGATTENPSFEIIGPLLSRCRVFVLERLSQKHIKSLLKRALKDKEKGLGNEKLEVTSSVLDFIAYSSNGDARIALNALEVATQIAPKKKYGKKVINKKVAQEALQQKTLLYDKAGEEHYNTVSAFIKSLRGSDPDASLYWLARMVEAGEDPRFIARRMVIFASEDIGNADPQALQIATAAAQAVEFVGMPEAQINLSQAVTYLATAPKSNASYMALLEAKEDVKESLNEPIPLHLRNAPTPLMKKQGYSKGYRYPHSYPGHFVKEEYLPQSLKNRRYYRPTEQGEEIKIRERLKKLK
ncbi:AAA family ATPase [Candidatus Curtissbacteria bacterium RBG_16_39_7]|uniref:Replication-associated recombination protein A n=1 Tax=Candidatus Curtissbacteria bacterium RBG_16_39_7 TaxID=1797707 RepID=A0A1F5G2K0_9BACT|nr:MAG: AAA family ATPase [Candidatus Curtissbacteria bacterium RBG_16_39_7]